MTDDGGWHESEEVLLSHPIHYLRLLSSNFAQMEILIVFRAVEDDWEDQQTEGDWAQRRRGQNWNSKRKVDGWFCCFVTWTAQGAGHQCVVHSHFWDPYCRDLWCSNWAAMARHFFVAFFWLWNRRVAWRDIRLYKRNNRPKLGDVKNKRSREAQEMLTVRRCVSNKRGRSATFFIVESCGRDKKNW